MDKKVMSMKIQKVLDERREEIITLGSRIYKSPETGYKEFKTAKIVADKFREIGLECVELKDIPGVKATIDTGREGPGIAIMGELDSVICYNHPDSDAATGAIHACGHNIQIANMMGAAIAILNSDVIDKLSGKIHFIAVPAEEYIEVGFRMELREKGIIKYLGGKPELLYRGFFDDVDMCIKTHVLNTSNSITIKKTCNGCVVKKIRYIGKAAHAGIAPHEGINALYAANIGLMAINSIRETFREKDYIRVHPIITKGGDIVNAIPSEVCAETFVRGKTMDAIVAANKKVNNALIGGAVAMGAKVEIEDIPGYFPVDTDDNLIELSKGVVKDILKDEELEISNEHNTGSTDVGDLSTIMPVVEPWIGGVEGGLHSAQYKIVDPEIAYIFGSKYLACMAIELACNGAKEAKRVVENYKPMFASKEEYFKFVDGLFSKRVLPEYDCE